MAKEYKKLNKVANYDKEAAEELADALNELATLEARAKYLRDLVNENPELHHFVWRTGANQSIALHKIEDSHLVNIMTHLLATDRTISREIRAEAMSRSLTIPTEPTTMYLGDGSIIDDEEAEELWQESS